VEECLYQFIGGKHISHDKKAISPSPVLLLCKTSCFDDIQNLLISQ